MERLILSRPAVEAGERLGFLPGDMKEKIDPYLRPLYDALFDMMPSENVERMIENGQIEVAPLAFMRGRTLANSFVILDEAQNTTPAQMKMFLTRMGENSRVCVTGDLSQIDLPPNIKSGLKDAIEVLEKISGISIIRFSGNDIIRHPMVTRIVNAYDKREEITCMKCPQNKKMRKTRKFSAETNVDSPSGLLRRKILLIFARQLSPRFQAKKFHRLLAGIILSAFC